MNAQRKRGFTLLEVLMVVALSGLVVTLGIAPVMRIVQNVVTTEKKVGREGVLRMGARSLVGDMHQRAALPGEHAVAFRIVPRSKFGDTKDDVVFFWSSAPLIQGQSASTVAYALYHPGFFNSFEAMDSGTEEKKVPMPQGLYRWFLPGVLPEKADPDRLNLQEGQLVLPGVEVFRVEAHDGGNWKNRYEGPVPAGIRVELGRASAGGGTHNGDVVAYEDWFPR